MAIGRVESLELQGKLMVARNDAGEEAVFHSFDATERELLQILFKKLKEGRL